MPSRLLRNHGIAFSRDLELRPLTRRTVVLTIASAVNRSTANKPDIDAQRRRWALRSKEFVLGFPYAQRLKVANPRQLFYFDFERELCLVSDAEAELCLVSDAEATCCES